MHADRVYVDEAFRAGADGYLLKTARAAELRHALGEILSGETYVTPELRSARVGPGDVLTPSVQLEGELGMIEQLTDRQRQVLLLVGQGFSTQEIATRLGISPKAIEYHRAGIRHALAISSQASFYRIATVYAERLGTVEK